MDKFYIAMIKNRLKELGFEVPDAILEIAINEVLARKRSYDHDEAMGRYI